MTLLATGCRKATPGSIMLYCDPEPHMTYWTLWYFTHEYHIKVEQAHNPKYSPAFTVERLTLERDKPKADIYWSGDPIFCEILRQRGMTISGRHQFEISDEFQDKDNYWTGVAARARVLLVWRGITKEKPQTIRAYTDPDRRGRGALADPLIGTTRSHFAALGVLWGDKELARFYDDLRKNGTRITKTNEESAALVASGESDFALVDTDVALKEIDKGSPVEIIYPDQGRNEVGAMAITNALTILKSCKDPEAAQKLIDFMTSVENEVRLVRFELSYIPLRSNVSILSPYVRHAENLHLMHFDYADAAQKYVDMEKILKPDAGEKKESASPKKANPPGDASPVPPVRGDATRKKPRASQSPSGRSTILKAG